MAIFFCGALTNTFFVVFRKALPNLDTVYGWIKLDSNLPGTIYDYAYTCASHTTTLPAPVLNNTTSVICAGESLTLTGTPSGGIFSGVGVTGNVFNPNALQTGNQILYYTGPSIAGCPSTSSMNIFVNACTGLKENNFADDVINVYPNPATDKIKIVISGNNLEKEIEIKIFDLTGELIKQSIITQKENEIDVSEMKSGIYFLNTVVDDRRINKKICIVR